MSSYTLSYEDEDISTLVNVNSLYDDVIPRDDVIPHDDVTGAAMVETDAGCKVAMQLDFG